MIITTVEKTGHQYYGTKMAAYEATDNCGTCNGLCCESCKTRYTVEDTSENRILYCGYNKKEAERATTKNEIVFKFFSKMPETKDHVVTIEKAPEYVSPLAYRLLEMFTHEQLPKVHDRLYKMAERIRSIQSDKETIRTEIVTYRVPSQNKEKEMAISTMYTSIDGTPTGNLCINFYYVEDQETDENKYKENENLLSLLYDADYNRAGEKYRVNEMFSTLLMFVSALYDATEVLAPESARNHFLDVSDKVTGWDILMREIKEK